MITKQEIKEYMKFNNLDIIELKSNSKNIIRYIKYIWFSIAMALSLSFVYIFHGAYINKAFMIVVDINKFNEAHIEAFIIVVWLILSIILTYDYFKKN